MLVEIQFSKEQADLEYAAKLLVIAAKRLAIKEGKLPLSENISNDTNNTVGNLAPSHLPLCDGVPADAE